MIKFTKLLSTIIYTNYSIVVFIFKQTTLITNNTNKLNLRLIKNFQYFFNFNIAVRHKIDKFNVIFNVLFRFSDTSRQQNVTNKIDILNVLYDHVVKLLKYKLYFFILQNLLTIIYHATLMKIFNNFKQRLKNVYVNNFY